jgi:serine/threonine protein kinase
MEEYRQLSLNTMKAILIHMTKMMTNVKNKLRYKIKEYLFSDLRDNKESILKRCILIEYLSIQFDFFPETKYIFLKDRIIYKQKYIEKVRTDKLTTLELEFHIKEFAENLDKLNNTNFIHGDINLSNIIFDGLRFNLIDFEPAFYQIKNEKIILKSGVNIRSTNDKLFKKITTETDKIGFYFFIKKAYFDLNKSYGKFEYNDVYLLNHEQSFLKKNYLEISKIFFK